MTAKAKEKVAPEFVSEVDGAEIAPAPTMHKLKNIGVCLIRVNMKDVAPEKTFEVDDVQLHSQAIKYLFNRSEIEFDDDPKRTREHVEAIRKGARKPEVKSFGEREEGREFS